MTFKRWERFRPLASSCIRVDCDDLADSRSWWVCHPMRRSFGSCFWAINLRMRSWSTGIMPAVLRAATHLLGDADDAEDAVQDAFVRAYTHLGSYREQDRFGAWVLRIVVNQCRTPRCQTRTATAAARTHGIHRIPRTHRRRRRARPARRGRVCAGATPRRAARSDCAALCGRTALRRNRCHHGRGRICAQDACAARLHTTARAARRPSSFVTTNL